MVFVFLLVVVFLPCKTILGARGSGKSTGLAVDLLAAAMMGIAVVVLDRPGTLARAMVGHLCAAGLESKTLIEIASDTDRVLRFPYIQNSDKPGLDGERENEFADECFAQAFGAKRGVKRLEGNPYTNKYVRSPAAIFRSQPDCTAIPIGDFEYIFRPGVKKHDELFASAHENRPVLEMMQVEARARRNPIQYEIETGASERLLSILWKSAVVRIRHGKGVDWTELLKQKAQVYFDLANITEEAARTIAILVAHSAINAARKHFYETKKPLPVVIVLEEAGALDLVTPFIISSMQELRKAGVSIWLVSQDFEPATFEQLLGLTEEHLYYRVNSGVDRAAEDCAHPSFDPNAVHYERERVVSDGFEAIRTTVRGSSEDQTIDGKKRKRKDSRESVSYLPVQHVVMDKYVKPYELQKQEWATKLSTQKVGERVVVGLSGVRVERIIPLGEPWPLGLSQIRTLKVIDRIRSKPPFQQVQPEPPAEQQVQKSPSTQPSAPPAPDSLLFG